MTLSRRQFGQDTLGALLTYSLLDMLLARDALGEQSKALAAKWIKDLNDLSQDVKGKKFSQVQWQKKAIALGWNDAGARGRLKLFESGKAPQDK